ncbi:MAG: hypothetical protein ABI772_07040 [Bacteroidota bacterium]
MENKYQKGDFVHTKKNPQVKLIVRRFVGHTYYCIVKDDASKKEMVYLENELLQDVSL